jgi:WD40 repeat protein
MNKFNQRAHVCDGGEAWGVYFDGKRTVLLANGSDGLRAYDYDGKALINTAHVHDAGHALKVTMDSKNRVYLANIYDGLRVYDYSGHSFEMVAWYDGSSSANCRGVTLGPDSIVHFVDRRQLVALQASKKTFLVGNRDKVLDWIHSYTLYGTIGIQRSDGQEVTIHLNGLLYVATGGSGEGGIEVYSYDSIARSYRLLCVTQEYYDSRSVAVSQEGTVFVACFTQGLKVYDWNAEANQLSFKTAINDGGEALSVKVAPDGTILLANGSDGLRAYSYDGASFVNVAHVNDGGRVCDVAVGGDGTVFLASETEGLFVYETK